MNLNEKSIAVAGWCAQRGNANLWAEVIKVTSTSEDGVCVLCLSKCALHMLNNIFVRLAQSR